MDVKPKKSDMVSFRADPEMLEKLGRVQKRAERPMADVVRRLVVLGLRTLAGRKL